MTTIRRWYLFLVCAVSLQAVTWGVITLLRGLLIPGMGAPTELFSFQIAVIIIGLPLFLAHWHWAQAREQPDGDESETAPAPYPLYLYGLLAGFIGPFAANTFDLIFSLLQLALGAPDHSAFDGLVPTETIVHSLVALVVLGLLTLYFRRLLVEAPAAAPETDYAAALQRLYLLGLSAVGLTITIAGIVNLLRWTLFRLELDAAIGAFGNTGLVTEVGRLAVGLPLWLLPWGRVQAQFAGPSQTENESALRKLYLYVIVFVATLSAVTNAALIVGGFLRGLLGLEAAGDIRLPLSMIIGMGLLWAYHATVLHQDAELAKTVWHQADIRRLYLYLVAAIGMGALLIGLSADISILIQLVSEPGFGDGLREQLAWGSATLLAGLPVWLGPWRQAQLAALAASPAGAQERRSLGRKIYLYLYLFIATITVLVSTVFIISQLLTLVFGAGDAEGLFSGLAHAIAFSLIAGSVWLYHSALLRGDRRLERMGQSRMMTQVSIAIVDDGDGQVGRAVLDKLRQALPGVILYPVGLTPKSRATLGASAEANTAAQLADSNLIIGPWTMAAADSEVAKAISTSQARKLLLPVRPAGWEWAGVEPWDEKASIRHTVRAAQQVLAGEIVKPGRQLSGGALVVAIVGGGLLLIMLAIPLIILLVR